VSSACRDQVGQSVGGNNLGAADGAEDDVPGSNTKPAFSAAAFGMEDTMDGGGEEEDFGGLMVCVLSPPSWFWPHDK
jgi:hypothetical protein